MIIAPDNITDLQPGEVFCFGSNLAGRMGKGAAKQALKFGAIYGQGTGRAGQTYAIATKDHNLNVLPLEEIEAQVSVFLEYAKYRQDELFLVTAIGTGLAGIPAEKIAPFFRNAPINVALPAAFADLL